MISRGTRWSIAAALTAATLVGCSSTTTGTATPTPTASSAPAAIPTPSPSPSPSRTVTRPVLPDAAAQPTRDGAEAFVRYFFETFDYAYVALDDEPFRAASEEQCEFCRKVLTSIENLRSDGGSISGGETTVLSTLVSPGKPETGVVVVTRYRQTAATIIDADGVTVKTEAPIETSCQLVLGWRPSGWQVYGLAKVS